MISYDLKLIRAVAFDVDGVLSPSTIPLGPDGMPSRMVNIKDGYAMQLAVKRGLKLAIITGADSEAIAVRYRALGVSDIYLRASSKLPILHQWMELHHLEPYEVAYLGDDIPDLPCMQAVDLSVAPADAALEIRQAARYVSPIVGGYGVGRDVLEQVMKAKGLWMNNVEAFGW
nr:HAD hydrolase family protein [Bacteroides sp.]